ncbi:hypothetical protein Y1Q_0011317 [Alligator mississippiensis]|uniref:Uncharacterized protein n=1 Tax=Alligator mississippiensis TaxID=8496 RepID=A0A151N857_ALLMI|nr:hypothetical protein Y1Q_0011317 [Alligator mississippiensis]
MHVVGNTVPGSVVKSSSHSCLQEAGLHRWDRRYHLKSAEARQKSQLTPRYLSLSQTTNNDEKTSFFILLERGLISDPEPHLIGIFKRGVTDANIHIKSCQTYSCDDFLPEVLLFATEVSRCPS